PLTPCNDYRSSVINRIRFARRTTWLLRLIPVVTNVIVYTAGLIAFRLKCVNAASNACRPSEDVVSSDVILNRFKCYTNNTTFLTGCRGIIWAGEAERAGCISKIDGSILVKVYDWCGVVTRVVMPPKQLAFSGNDDAAFGFYYRVSR